MIRVIAYYEDLVFTDKGAVKLGWNADYVNTTTLASGALSGTVTWVDDGTDRVTAIKASIVTAAAAVSVTVDATMIFIPELV
jgi:hypothetical protein